MENRDKKGSIDELRKSLPSEVEGSDNNMGESSEILTSATPATKVSSANFSERTNEDMEAGSETAVKGSSSEVSGSVTTNVRRKTVVFKLDDTTASQDLQKIFDANKVAKSHSKSKVVEHHPGSSKRASLNEHEHEHGIANYTAPTLSMTTVHALDDIFRAKHKAYFHKHPHNHHDHHGHHLLDDLDLTPIPITKQFGSKHFKAKPVNNKKKSLTPPLEETENRKKSRESSLENSKPPFKRKKPRGSTFIQEKPRGSTFVKPRGSTFDQRKGRESLFGARSNTSLSRPNSSDSGLFSPLSDPFSDKSKRSAGPFYDRKSYRISLFEDFRENLTGANKKRKSLIESVERADEWRKSRSGRKSAISENIRNRQHRSHEIPRHYVLKKTRVYEDVEKIDEEFNEDHHIFQQALSDTSSVVSLSSDIFNPALNIHKHTSLKPAAKNRSRSRGRSNALIIDTNVFEWTSRRKSFMPSLEQRPKKKPKRKRPVATSPEKNLVQWFKNYFFLSSSGSSLDLRPDASWLIEYSLTDLEDQRLPNPKRSCLMLAYMPYWLSLFVMGRMPFHFVYDRKLKTYICKMETHDFRFRHFVWTSVFIFVATFIYFISFLKVFVTRHHDPDEDPPLLPYSQLELLLLEKHWLAMTIHLTMLIMATITSFTVWSNGNFIANYITEFDASVKNLHYDPFQGFVTRYAYVDISFLIGNFLLSCILYSFNLCGMKESVQLSGILYFRMFIDEVYFDPYFRYLCWVVLVLHSYMLFCARTFIHMLLFYCKVMCSLAKQWNTQAYTYFALDADVENLSNPKTKFEKTAGEVKVNHEMLFDYHIIITDLVRGASKAFSVVILFYYFFQILDFTYGALALSTVFTHTTYYKKFNDTAVANLKDGHHVKYKEPTPLHVFEILYYLLFTILGFIFTSLSISSVGEMIMSGSHIIRKFNLMSSRSSQDRRFCLSMEMSFARKKKPVIRPGGFFGIDREFILNASAGALYLTCLMIQIKIEPLIKQPIIFPCTSPPSKICFGIQYVPGSEANLTGLGPHLTQVIRENTLYETTSTEPTPTGIGIETTKAPRDQEIIIDLPSDTDLAKFIPETTINTTSLVIDSLSYNRLCKSYCPNTLVQRLVLYNAETKRKINLPTDLENCVFHPYEKIQVPVTDCVGTVGSATRGECGAYDFNPVYSTDRLPVRRVNVELTSTSYKSCYAAAPLGQSDDIFHPLEIAGFPSTSLVFVGIGFEETVFKDLKLPEVRTQKDNVEVACTLESVGLDYGNVIDNDEYFLNVKDPQKIHIMYRPYAHTFLFSQLTGYRNTRRKIPIPEESLSVQVVRPYAYLPPQKIKGKTYGYYDCFGYYLEKFDDCGYLPFSLVVQQNGILVRKEPGTITVQVNNGETGTTVSYRCYESWNPEYKCGVPLKYVEFVCNSWKTYVKTNIP